MAIRHVRVVLMQPRNPGNIGACARAMANFGVRDLVVVDPYEPVWQETRAAPGAEKLIQEARVTKTLTEAVDGCPIIVGTSSFHQRPLETAVIELPNLNRYVASYPASESMALVFGSERSGLSNEELVRCQAVLRIPTDKSVPSMNLGQAVAVVLYECRRAGWDPGATPAPAPAQEQELLWSAMAELGQSVNYPAGFEPPARLGRIRRAFQDSVLTPAAVRYLLSFIRKLNKEWRPDRRAQ